MVIESAEYAETQRNFFDVLWGVSQEAEVDEIVVVTPNLDRARRTASFRAIADAWRTTTG